MTPGASRESACLAAERWEDKRMERSDKTITCVDCGKEFIFTAREREHYRGNGFEHEPKRCRECRARMKRKRHLVRDSAGNVREYFKCACASCGRPAYLPFKPKGTKPVYCRDCLVRLEGEQGSSNDSEGTSPDGPDAGSPPPA